MVPNPVQTLSQVASYLKVPAGKINISDDACPTRTGSKITSKGYFNILSQLIKESGSVIDGKNPLEVAEIRGWIEYSIIYALNLNAASDITQVLTELNSILSTKTYLVSNRLTVADIFLYYILFSIVENLSILDKERYIHVSRWFDNLQQNPQIRQSNKTINFNTIYLATVVPARH